MNHHYSPKSGRHSAVIVAVRERYQKVHQSIPDLTAEVERARKAVEDARLRLNEAKDELAELGDYLERHLEPKELELDSAQSSGAKRMVAFDIEARVELLLSQTSPLKTSDIWSLLSEQGVELSAANPVQRISQILSESKRFQNDRARGWSLVENPKNEAGPVEDHLPYGIQVAVRSVTLPPLPQLGASHRAASAIAALEQLPINPVKDPK